MKRTLYIKTTVLPGGRIVVENPELSEGDEVDIVVSAASPPTGRSAADILASSKYVPTSEKPEEVDEYIRRERDSWHK